ncbi:MAG: hypothetical protein ACREA4_08300 [Nitrososphaera sp.]
MNINVKEQIVELIRAEGYDFLRACELAQNCLDEIKAKPSGVYQYHIGAIEITFKWSGKQKEQHYD